jgi:hypothetical protein
MPTGLLEPILFIFAGVLILIKPKLLNYIVALAFILYGSGKLLVGFF